MDKTDRLILRLKELEEECWQRKRYDIASEISSAVTEFLHESTHDPATCPSCQPMPSVSPRT